MTTINYNNTESLGNEVPQHDDSLLSDECNYSNFCTSKQSKRGKRQSHKKGARERTILGEIQIEKGEIHAIKSKILKKARNFEHLVGRNPNIEVVDGDIFLVATHEKFLRRRHNTGLKAKDFFKKKEEKFEF